MRQKLIFLSKDMPENSAPTEITLSSEGHLENLTPGTEAIVLWERVPDANVPWRNWRVYQKGLTLPKAITLANRKSGHPAVIGSQAEWDLMLSQIGRENLIGKIALLGASDEDTEGEWKWLMEEI